MIKRIVISACCTVLLAGMMSAGPASAKSKLPKTIIGFTNLVAIVDGGRPLYPGAPAYPPISEQAAKAAANQVCAAMGGVETRIASDGKTLGVEDTRMIGRPSNNSFERVPQATDFDGSLAAAGYFTYQGVCVTGAVHKKLPKEKFYEIYVNDEKIGTYPYKKLKKEKFSKFLVAGTEACYLNLSGEPGLKC